MIRRRATTQLVTVCLCLLAIPAASAATWHVNNVTGKATHDGSAPDRAFARIARAIAKVQAGDTVVLANTGRPYHEGLRLGGKRGEPGRPIVIEGNGSVISGYRAIPPTAWKAQADGLYVFTDIGDGIRRQLGNRRRYHLLPWLRDGDRMMPRVRPKRLGRGEAYWWTAKELVLRPAEGKTPGDYRLSMTTLKSVVTIANSHYIVVRDLVCEGASNDGFNIHGDCQGMFFENIEGRYNGDDGFSIHEDISAVVRGGWFHHNTYGVQDVNASRSVYFGVLTEHNRSAGLSFHGGVHLVADSVSRDNPLQIQVTGAGARHIGLPETNLSTAGLTVLKNVLAQGGETGLLVRRGGRAMASNCVFEKSAVGVSIEADSACHLAHCVIADCRRAELVNAAKQVELDNNLYWPGRFSWLGKTFTPDQWAPYRQATSQDKTSRIAKPDFVGDGSRQLKVAAPKRRQLRPGLTRPALRLPNSPAPPD